MIAVLKEVLTEHRLTWEVNRYSDEWFVAVPSDLPVPNLHLAIQQRMHAMGVRFLSSRIEPSTGRLDLAVGWEDSCYLKIRIEPVRQKAWTSGTIALLIDDFGSRWDAMARGFLELDIPLSFSVIPGQRESRRIAREAAAGGVEIWLHLSMEPLNGDVEDDGYTILSGMDTAPMAVILDRALQDVPGVAGVNNHMGSRVTSDRQTMGRFLDLLKEEPLIFLDSRTTAATVAYDLAREKGIPALKRDVFLDSENREDFIRGQIHLLADTARRQGRAIGIGHCRQRTLHVLKEEIPGLLKAGYRFVLLSQMADTP